jgi:GT2 family glycosyltransferase
MTKPKRRRVNYATVIDAAPDVAVLIVNFKGKELTVECVRSVEASVGVRVHAFVIDNASGDGSYEYLRDQLPAATVVAEPVNRGYPGGNNTALRLASQVGARYAFILNNDTIVDPECIAWLVAEADAHRDVGLLTPQIRFHSPSDRLWFGGGRFSLWTGRALHVGWMKPLQFGLPAATDISWATGCAVLLPMDVVRRIGPLDESLFGYSEDLDWSLRFRRAGYRLRYVPDAVIWHREGFGYQKLGGQALRMYLMTRNTLRVLGRHAKWYHWITLGPSFLVNHLARWTYLTLVRDNDRKSLGAMYRGVWHALTGGRDAIEPAPRRPEAIL